MRYAKGVAITLVAKALAIPIGIATSIITARALGPSGRGVLAILLTVQTMAIQFGTLGFNASITYFISRDKNSTASVASLALVSAIMLGIVAVGVVGTVGLLAPEVLMGNASVTYLYIFLAALPFSFFPQFFQNVFIAQQKLYEFNALDLVSRILQLLGFFVVLILLHRGTTEAVWCFVLVTIATGMIYLLQTRAVTPLAFRFDPGLFRAMIRYGVKTYIAGLFVFFVTRLNIFLVNSMLGESQVGLYAIALQFMDVLYLLPTTLGLILFPKVSANQDDPGALTAKVFRFSVLAMALMCGGIALVAHPVINLLFGEKFLDAVLPLTWLAPGMFALSLSNIILNDLAGRGLPPVVMIAPGVGLVANVALTVGLIHSQGIAAAAIGSSVAYWIMLAILFVYFVRRLRIPVSQMLLFRFSELRTIRLH
jgi:O-antigen/teichoic acid export membrane protein